jgi:hypothetical protein
MTTARSADLSRTAHALVVVAPEALAELVTTAVATALEGAASSGPAPLLDRVGIGRALDVSVATVDRLVRQGMPCLLVAEARRFELPAVLQWLRARKAGGNDGLR